VTGPIAIGTAAGGRCASVLPSGDVVVDRGGSLEWFVAADDRWHVPAVEPTVRQHRIGGTPVVETAVRVPTGDVVQRVFAVADGGGALVVELANASRLPVAIGLSRRDVRAARPLGHPPTGAPSGVAAVVPLAHGATTRVALTGANRLDRLSTSASVARGWRTFLDRSVRLVVPDEVLVERWVAARCDALLGVIDLAGDPAGALLAVVERSRSGFDVAPWVADVATAAERLVRRARRSPAWDDAVALEVAAELLRAAGEARGAADVDRMRDVWPAPAPDPPDPPAGVRLTAWLVRRLVRRVPDGIELFGDYPTDWRGSGAEAYGVPCRGSVVGAAVRWHGDRPALLWDVRPPVPLRCGLDRTWTAGSARGEALLRGPLG
jgi:hypothetical protein